MSKSLYDNLALMRINYARKNDEKLFRKMNSFYEMLYDLAEANTESPESLPKDFFISDIDFSKKDFERILNELEINAEVKLVKSLRKGLKSYHVTIS